MAEQSMNPWPHLSGMFELKNVSADRKCLKFVCLLCKPLKIEVMANYSSPSNLRKHVQAKHKHQLIKYSQLSSEQQRRKSVIQGDRKPSRPALSLFPLSRSAQSDMDKSVIKLIVDCFLPFGMVEERGFIHFIQNLEPRYCVMTQQTLRTVIYDTSKTVKSNVKKAMGEVLHIATTVDCWKNAGGDYIGVTAHWLNVQSLERESAVLACRRLNGNCTLKIVTRALDLIYGVYGIKDKVVDVTTQMVSNTVWDFSKHIESEDVDNKDGDDDYEAIQYNTSILNDQPMVYACIGYYLDTLAVNILPKTDFDEAYKLISRPTFSKCRAIWKKAGHSRVESEADRSEQEIQFLRPNPNRWESTFRAFERIVRIVKEKGERSVQDVCSSYHLKPFTKPGLAFLFEFVETVAPLVQASDLLKSDEKTLAGWILPTLYSLQSKLVRKRSTAVRCLPLIDTLLRGLEHCFEDTLINPEMIAASILLPKMKTAWTDDQSVIDTGLEYIRKKLAASNPSSDETSEVHEDSFFETVPTVQNCVESAVQLDTYLKLPTSDNLSLLAFPALRELSVRLNTPLPVSAACHRIFGCEDLLFTPRHANPSDGDFERQLLLKCNAKFAQ